MGTNGSFEEEPPLGVVLHELLSCNQAAQARKFLIEQEDLRDKLFTYLAREPAFERGGLAVLADPAGAAELVALLGLLTAARGADAEANLVLHMASRAEPYTRLLMPCLHSNQHVAALLILLGAHGQLEGVLLEQGAAPAYLRMLSVLAASLAASRGSTLDAGWLETRPTAFHQETARAITSLCSALPLNELLPGVVQGDRGAVQLLLSALQLEQLWSQLPVDLPWLAPHETWNAPHFENIYWMKRQPGVGYTSVGDF
ncbi:hypothetical protein ABPG75_002708 [Micractinium tetrahymenae]